METEKNNDAKAKRRDTAQLAVTHSLRQYQRDWFALMREKVAQGTPFVIGAATTPHEVLEALGIEFVADVWYSAVVSARRQSTFYSDYLTELGYHEGLSRYSALTLATVLHPDEEQRPWGGLPAPGLVTGNLHDRSGQVLAEHLDIPYVGFDVPAFRTLYPNWWEMSANAWEDLEQADRIDIMAAQIEDFIAACEKLTGKKLDRDHLREIVDRVNRQESYFEDVREMIRKAPKLPARLDEVMGQVMGIQWHRGTDWALNQARAFCDEVRARVEAEDWVCPNEQVRLMYVGAGLWQQLDFFASFERSHGVTFVRSNYLSFAIDGYQRFGTHDPVRALAARYVGFNRHMHVPPMAGAWAAWEARTHRVTGALQIDSGRGMKFITRTLEQEGIPVLQLPVDPVLAKSWDEERMRATMTEFLEEKLAVKRLSE